MDRGTKHYRYGKRLNNRAAVVAVVRRQFQDVRDENEVGENIFRSSVEGDAILYSSPLFARCCLRPKSTHLSSAWGSTTKPRAHGFTCCSERFTADTLNPGKISRSIVEARSSREIKKANSRGLWSEKGTTTNIRSGWLTVWRRARMEGPRPTWGSRRVFQPDAAWEEPRVPYVKIGTSVLCCTSPICLTRWESRPGVVRQGARRANLGVSGVPPGHAGTLFHLFSPGDMSMPSGIAHQETLRSYHAGLLYAYIKLPIKYTASLTHVKSSQQYWNRSAR